MAIFMTYDAKCINIIVQFMAKNKKGEENARYISSSILYEIYMQFSKIMVSSYMVKWILNQRKNKEDFMQTEITGLLKREMKPALGVTEVGAIALAAAKAMEAAKGSQILRIRMTMNGGMYKNAFSCAIPGTEERGCEMAALLGVLCGNSRLELECLRNVTADAVELAKNSGIAVDISVDASKEDIYLLAEVETDKGIGKALIEAWHNNLTKVWQNEKLIFSNDLGKSERTATFPFDAVNIEDFVSYADTVPDKDLLFLQDMIDMNCRLAAAGEAGVGLRIGKAVENFRQKGFVGQDAFYEAQHLTICAMDARLAGLPYPAMSIVGSGSHGIICSLPVVSFGRGMRKSEKEIRRALALSCLITIYSKHYTGRLSSLCGCVLGGGSGAAAGIAYLMGGGVNEIGAAMNHMAANLSGMICDGGNIGCSLKVASGVQAAFLSAMLATEGVMMPPHFGILGSSAEQTAKNLGHISKKGMAAMDSTILDIMQRKK